MVADPSVVNRHRWKPRSKITPPVGVTMMLALMGPRLANAGREYLRLARSVESFLAQRSLRGWGRLDVEAFVCTRARSQSRAIEVCCNLSAMLPHLIASGELSIQDATELWVSLLEVCPEDEDSEAYILRGLEDFGDPGMLPWLSADDWETTVTEVDLERLAEGAVAR